MFFKSPLTEEELEEKKKLIQDFYIHTFNKYYILEQQQYHIKKLFHRHTVGDFYHVIIEDTIEDIIIEYLQQHGKIYDIRQIDNQMIFTIGTHFGSVIFKLYSVDEDSFEVR